VSEPFEIVRQGYDVIGPRYRDWSSHSPVRLAQVARLLARLPPDALVLELGCGSGEPATRLISAQHRVIGVDASHPQLRLAGQAAPSALLVQADMTRLCLQPGSLDAVVSFYALGHLPSSRHAPLFREVARWLRPGGLLFTSAPVGAGEGEEDWLGVRMFFGGIGEAATREAVLQAGLVPDDLSAIPEDEGDGKIVSFLWLVARKPGPGVGP
jgi:SAM-dependent methyltransferase